MHKPNSLNRLGGEKKSRPLSTEVREMRPGHVSSTKKPRPKLQEEIESSLLFVTTRFDPRTSGKEDKFESKAERKQA